jgi:L-alanine-DL-glutamate epimerase-like enolase superfamily enzyme
MSIIDRVEIHAFTFEVENLGLGKHAAAGVGNMVYMPGSRLKATRFAVRIRCDDGAQGEYVAHWVGTPSALGQAQMLAPGLLGRDPEQRALIYDDLKREVRAYDHMGHGVLDIALWDLAGKKYQTSVAKLIGAFRERLPTYASTYHGQLEPGGLDTPEAYADYALACKEAGFVGFKIHGWHDGDARKEARNLLQVRERVGPDMALMIDPACQLRTFLDALYVGQACDEANYFWYEDPYRDSGVSAMGHQRLREKLKTHIMVS